LGIDLVAIAKIRWEGQTVGVVDVTDDCDHESKKSLMLTANEIEIYHNDGLVIPKKFLFSDEEVKHPQ